MKNLLLLPLIAVIFLSCSKNNPPAPKPTTLIAKWNMVGDSLYFYLPAISKYPIVSAITIPHPSYYQFNSDGTGIFLSNESPADAMFHFNYTVKDTTIDLQYQDEVVDSIDYQATTDTLIIRQLTTDKLILLGSRYPGEEKNEHMYFTK